MGLSNGSDFVFRLSKGRLCFPNVNSSLFCYIFGLNALTCDDFLLEILILYYNSRYPTKYRAARNPPKSHRNVNMYWNVNDCGVHETFHPTKRALDKWTWLLCNNFIQLIFVLSWIEIYRISWMYESCYPIRFVCCFANVLIFALTLSFTCCLMFMKEYKLTFLFALIFIHSLQ